MVILWVVFNEAWKKKSLDFLRISWSKSLFFCEYNINVHLVNPFTVHPSMSEVLLYAKSYNKIITIAVSSDSDELITGYIEAYDEIDN